MDILFSVSQTTGPLHTVLMLLAAVVCTSWLDRIANKELWKTAGKEQVLGKLRRRKWADLHTWHWQYYVLMEGVM